MMNKELIHKVSKKVNANPNLVRELLYEYDWPNRDEHLEWLKTASTEDVASWLQGLGREVLDESTIYEANA